jgi:hypothetical protein
MFGARGCFHDISRSVTTGCIGHAGKVPEYPTMSPIPESRDDQLEVTDEAACRYFSFSHRRGKRVP